MDAKSVHYFAFLREQRQARLVTWTVGERKSAPRLAVELRGLQPLQGEMREMAALNKEGQGAGQVTPSSENLRAGTSVQEEESP